MKRSLGLFGVTVVTLYSQTVLANNLEYMMNPPKERGVSEIQAEIDKTQADIQRSKGELQALKKELAKKMTDLAPAAGGKSSTDTNAHYDNYLGH